MTRPIVEKNIYQAVTLCLSSDYGTIFLKTFRFHPSAQLWRCNLQVRNNALKIQSSIHIQFASSGFVNVSLSTLDEMANILQKNQINVRILRVEYCLKNCGTQSKFCNDVAIIRCALCTDSIYIKYFFTPITPHYLKKIHKNKKPTMLDFGFACLWSWSYEFMDFGIIDFRFVSFGFARFGFMGLLPRLWNDKLKSKII